VHSAHGSVLALFGAAVTSFLATNLDALAILAPLVWLPPGGGRRLPVLIGCCVGNAAVLALAVLAGAGLGAVPDGQMHWVGLLPIGMGIYRLLPRRGSAADRDGATGPSAQPGRGEIAQPSALLDTAESTGPSALLGSGECPGSIALPGSGSGSGWVSGSGSGRGPESESGREPEREPESESESESESAPANSVLGHAAKTDPPFPADPSSDRVNAHFAVSAADPADPAEAPEPHVARKPSKALVAHAGLTLALGGDNIAILAPLLRALGPGGSAVVVAAHLVLFPLFLALPTLAARSAPEPPRLARPASACLSIVIGTVIVAG
jgi:cadmium resistance protein CadD (predicted permease)